MRIKWILSFKNSVEYWKFMHFSAPKMWIREQATQNSSELFRWIRIQKLKMADPIWRMYLPHRNLTWKPRKGPPNWICHFQFSIVYCRFILSDPKRHKTQCRLSFIHIKRKKMGENSYTGGIIWWKTYIVKCSGSQYFLALEISVEISIAFVYRAKIS